MKKIFLWLIAGGCIATGACKKKQEDDLYTTRIAIAQFVPNADSIRVLYDGDRVTGSRALSYGTASSQNGIAYLALGSGTHNLGILSGTTALNNKIYSFGAGNYYSLFLYDSLKAGAIKTALLQDAVTKADTLAQVRFINMIAGNESLQIIFKKDTSISSTDTYLGSKTSPSYPFSTLRPGSWSVSLLRNSAVIVQPASYDLQAGKLYSFVAKGIKGATGVYTESLLLMKHN
ncbi:MAG: DUF4397 domain-containing protein [Williamsia sp.]|nr:DUF4397 domain-containing protein [Williamsia sp.]